MLKATNNERMRRTNRQLILSIIQKEPVSRSEIAEKTGLTRASVTIITEELIREGLVREERAQGRGVGRHPVSLAICGDALYFGGISVHRQWLEVGVIDLAGHIVTQHRLEVCNGEPKAMLLEACRLLQTQPLPLHSVGISAPGPLDHHTGEILTPPNFANWHHLPVMKIVQDAADCPIIIEQDVNAMALEEMYFSSTGNLKSFCILLVDSGVGFSAVADGLLLRGANGRGFELGHTALVLDGLPCSCGNRGCLERYLSVDALLLDSPFVSWAEMMDKYEISVQAHEVIERAASYLAWAIVNMVNLLGIETFFLRGDITYKGQALCEMVNKKIAGRIMNGNRPVVGESVLRRSSRTGAMAAVDRFFRCG